MATPEEIKIRIIAADEASKVFDKTRGASDRLSGSISKLKIALAGISVAGGLFLKSVISTGAQVQSLQVRLKYLTGSTEDGAKAFQIMSKYASTVPFALEEIQQGAANLLTVANNVDELNGLLQITGDIAAVSGMSFVETAMQLQRAFAGGIAAAEMFREKGVRELLGFQQGVQYTASETRNQIISAFRNGTTTAVGATKDLAKTFQGEVSMMQDAWFNLKVSLADTGLVDEATKQIQLLTSTLKDPEIIKGVKIFTGALLELFQFVTRNAKVLIAVGTTWLGINAGKGLGELFGKKGKVIGGAVGGMGALLATFKLLNEEDVKLLQDLTVYVDATETASEGFNKLSTAVRNTSTEVKDLKDKFEVALIQMEDVAVQGVKSLEDSLVDFTMGTKTAKEAFNDMARSILNDLIRMQIRASITSPLSQAIGGFFKAQAVPSTTGLTAEMGSFAGGGYTGAGARSGGVDGKGGFPAILHPNETVIDHNKGQGMSGAPVTVNLNVSTGVSDTVRAELQSMLPRIAEVTKAAVVDARRRGGAFATAFGA